MKISMADALKLSDVLSGADRFPSSHALFLPPNEEWQENTGCLVVDAEDEPGRLFAERQGLIYALGIHAMQDIVLNAREQDSRVGISELIDAFLFYYDHDAFIDFKDLDPRCIK